MKVVRKGPSQKKHSRVLVVSKKSRDVLQPEVENEDDPWCGKGILCEDSGQRFYAVVRGVSGEKLLQVQPAAMDLDGVLSVSRDSDLVTVPRSCVHNVLDVEVQERLVKKFSLVAEMETKAVTLRDDQTQRVVDYQDVMVSGMASLVRTMANPDRDREWVMEGAFRKSLPTFMKNPVMLLDHVNKVDHLAGSFTKVSQLPSGLGVEGKLSNAPGLKDVRFKIMEGHLRAFSIGGLFFYQEGSFAAIEQVDLFEITLIPVPADQDALFQVRSVNLEDAKSAFGYSTKRASW